MDSCPMLEFCKCSPEAICLFCKLLVIICIALGSGIIGYFIGRKKTDKPPAESEEE